MPYCPVCGAEFRKGFAECSDCGVELVEEEEDELFPDDEDESDVADEEEDLVAEEEADLVEIFSGPPFAAQMLANALKEQGIGAVVESDSDNVLIGPTESSVFVTETDYNEHDEIIQECLELVESESPDDHGEAFEDEEEI